jgi:hypothetical protein
VHAKSNLRSKNGGPANIYKVNINDFGYWGFITVILKTTTFFIQNKKTALSLFKLVTKKNTSNFKLA